MSALAIELGDGYLLVGVRANPGASKNAIQGVHDGRLKVSVTAAPEKGKANAAIEKVLAKELGVPKSSVLLQSGTTSREKRFRIETEDAAELARTLERLAE
ncbi:MAG: DUF167 domain-containing protein [Planctomycetota bacterium]